MDVCIQCGSSSSDNRLFIYFQGGYAEFIDPIDDGGSMDAVLCHECAHELCDKIPWIETLLSPLTGHTHTKRYMEENPHHQGEDFWEDQS